MSSPVRVLDDYYLAITLLVTVAYQLFFFCIAFSFKFDKLTDFAGGTNFVVLAILTLALSGGPDARQLAASVFLGAWGLRLSAFLLFRILKTGKDDRFDDKRDRFFPFLGFWVFQMLWVWLVSLPVTVLNSPAVRAWGGQQQPPFGSTARDVAGTVLFAVGFVMESVSDVQRYLFRSRNKDAAAVCDKGFFYFSRHPNYFGEIIIQFGIFTIAVSPAADGPVSGPAFSALYATILGPIFLTVLLLFVSGLTLQERPGAKKRHEKGGEVWGNYSRYLERTSILIPLPPQLYERVPTFLKRTVLLEWPMYVFDPAKHSDEARSSSQVDEERANIRDRGQAQ
ncbi:hypothetical protein GGTG_07760 [Gaeumannomyces tritici R3-111a-1]|uniref:Uncharacterized protein n=1 Tax=Gaeumannomyces tritici (strain R3-111a-1) TaxID=644352 RepID=J3P2L4_GAET3|nr:hypothetical protein GGTG_07760 [Gaeumannomyces tritici R3-111a-1]EJT73906.1 hypothetical protein GGTG_07760 [Gaeumannomyces tritici R3-111a-1]